MKARHLLPAIALLAALPHAPTAHAAEQPAPAAAARKKPPAAAPADARGRLLYETHCIACHTTKLHWRDDHKASDWMSLKSWVARWQSNLDLNWTEQDIAAVARHLNDRYYHFKQTGDLVGLVLDPHAPQ